MIKVLAAEMEGDHTMHVTIGVAGGVTETLTFGRNRDEGIPAMKVRVKAAVREAIIARSARAQTKTAVKIADIT